MKSKFMSISVAVLACWSYQTVYVSSMDPDRMNKAFDSIRELGENGWDAFAVVYIPGSNATRWYLKKQIPCATPTPESKFRSK